MKFQLIILSAIIFSLTSCSKKIYLTGNLMHILEENDIPLNKVQLYNDTELYLEREVTSNDAGVKSGKVIFQNGRFINKVNLEKQTRGVFVKEEKGQIQVSFESNLDKTLSFAPFAGPKGEFYYQLVDAAGSPFFTRLVYDGNKYLVLANKEKVKLMISKASLGGVKVKARKMKGYKIK